MDDYIIHYGVKGMKWGVRRNRRKAANARESAKEWDEIAADESS